MYVPKIIPKIFQKIVLIAHYTPLKGGLKKQAGHPQVLLPNNLISSSSNFKNRKYTHEHGHIPFPLLRQLNNGNNVDIYLTFYACKTAGAGFWVTEHAAVTAAILSGQADGSQLVLLFHVDLLHPRSSQQRPSLFCGQGLEKEVLIYFSVV